MNFESWLYKKGRFKTTIKKHLTRLSVIDRTVPVWTLENIDQFISGLLQKGLKNVSVNSYVDTIRLFSQFSGFQQELQNYRHYKIQYAVKGTLSDDEIESIINLPCPIDCDKISYDKYSLIYALLAYTGCRPQEICTLKRNQIDWGRNVFIIEHTKTGVPRNVPIPPNLAGTVQKYVQSLKTDDLFVSSRNAVISYKSYWHDFERRKKILKIDRPHISPYSFRHSYATTMLEADVNIHKIAKLMGHSIEQTATYEHLTTKDLREAINKHPLIRKYTNPKNILTDIKHFICSYQLDRDSRFIYNIKDTGNTLNINIKAKSPVSKLN